MEAVQNTNQLILDQLASNIKSSLTNHEITDYKNISHLFLSYLKGAIYNDNSNLPIELPKQ